MLDIPTKGKPSLMFADEAGKVVKAINRIDTAAVLPTEYGSFTATETQFTLDLSLLKKLIQALIPIAPSNAVFVVKDGVIQWLEPPNTEQSFALVCTAGVIQWELIEDC